MLVNALGSATIGDGPHFWAGGLEEGAEFGGLGLPKAISSADRALAWKGGPGTAGTASGPDDTPTATTIGVVATDMALTKPQAERLAIAAHDGELVTYAMERLSDLPGLRIIGPPADQRGGVVAFTFGDMHPHDLAYFLDSEGIAIRAGHHCAQPLHNRLGLTATARASFYLYNTPAEVDQLVNALKEIERRFRPQGRRRHRKTPDR